MLKQNPGKKFTENFSRKFLKTKSMSKSYYRTGRIFKNCVGCFSSGLNGGADEDRMVRLVVRLRSPSLEPSRAKSRDFTRSPLRRLVNGADEDRTRGLLLAKQALSQTELRPLFYSNHPEPVEGLLTPCLQSRCSPKLSYRP